MLLSSFLKFAPLLLLGAGGAMFLSRSTLGKALVQRIRQGSLQGEEVAALAAQLEEVRHELGEIQERLDFTERLLAQQRGALPPNGSSEHDSPTPPQVIPAGGGKVVPPSERGGEGLGVRGCEQNEKGQAGKGKQGRRARVALPAFVWFADNRYRRGLCSRE